MTDDEQRMLREMYNALMIKQPGQSEPLIERMAVMSKDWQRMGWAARGMLFLIFTFGSVAAAWDKIKAWLGVSG